MKTEDLTKLKNWSQECDCKDKVIIKMIHEGQLDEIMVYCLKCGGYVIQHKVFIEEHLLIYLVREK